ncbi:hypothetical protein MFRU_007g00390 [Monilinia fructicola]|nr:hypothetical protein MFRU_007g00390 [Monilinia fructicola]
MTQEALDQNGSISILDGDEDAAKLSSRFMASTQDFLKEKRKKKKKANRMTRSPASGLPQHVNTQLAASSSIPPPPPPTPTPTPTPPFFQFHSPRTIKPSDPMTMPCVSSPNIPHSTHTTHTRTRGCDLVNPG